MCVRMIIEWENEKIEWCLSLGPRDEKFTGSIPAHALQRKNHMTATGAKKGTADVPSIIIKGMLYNSASN